MRRRAVCFLFGLCLATAGCARRAPHGVAERYLESLQAYDYASCYGFLSSEDRAARTLPQFLTEVPLAPDVTSTWFRQVLHPGIRFEGKETNATGLQIADLLARPCAEKVANPASTPDRWPELRHKLGTGQETKHSIIGLKVVPWHERYEDLWKS